MASSKRSSLTCKPYAGASPQPELLRFAFAAGQFGVESGQLPQRVGVGVYVGKNRDRLQRIKVVRGEQFRGRPTVNGHRDPVVLPVDPSGELGQVSLTSAKGKSLMTLSHDYLLRTVNSEVWGLPSRSAEVSGRPGEWS